MRFHLLKMVFLCTHISRAILTFSQYRYHVSNQYEMMVSIFSSDILFCINTKKRPLRKGVELKAEINETLFTTSLLILVDHEYISLVEVQEPSPWETLRIHIISFRGEIVSSNRSTISSGDAVYRSYRSSTCTSNRSCTCGCWPSGCRSCCSTYCRSHKK